MLATGGIAAAVAATTFAATVAAAPRSGPGPVCGDVPTVNIQRNDLGFRAHAPSSTHFGARGHAKVNLRARTASGIGCQVNRDGSGILFSIGRRVLYSSHHARMFGVPGNVLKTHVTVKKTSDPTCAVGARGTITVFASYNGVHKDSVQLSFGAACRNHQPRYTGPQVTTNVPPN